MSDTATIPAKSRLSLRPRLWPRRAVAFSLIGLWGLAIFAVWWRDVAPLAAARGGADVLRGLFERPEGTRTRSIWMNNRKIGNLSSQIERLGPSSRRLVEEGAVRIETTLPLLGSIRADVQWELESYLSRAVGLRYLKGNARVHGLPSPGLESVSLQLEGWRRGGDLELAIRALAHDEKGEVTGDPLEDTKLRVPFSDRAAMSQPFSLVGPTGRVRVGQRWTGYLLDPLEMPRPRPKRMTFEVTERFEPEDGGEVFRVVVRDERRLEKGRALLSPEGDVLEEEVRVPLPVVNLRVGLRAIPRIDRVSPRRGPGEGGTVLTIEGAHFVPPARPKAGSIFESLGLAARQDEGPEPPVVTVDGVRAKLRPGWTATRLEIETPPFRFSDESGKTGDVPVSVRVSTENGDDQREEIYTYIRPRRESGGAP